MGKTATKVVSDDEWLRGATKPKARCFVCNDPALPEVSRVLKLISDSGLRIAKPRIYARLCDTIPGFGDRVGYHSFRHHVASCKVAR